MGRSEGRRQVGRPRLGGDYNIKINQREIV
jgi:hypothetical protein